MFRVYVRVGLGIGALDVANGCVEERHPVSVLGHRAQVSYIVDTCITLSLRNKTRINLIIILP